VVETGFQENGSPILPERDFYLSAYDVSSPSPRAAVREALRAYATGGQKSVHEVFLTRAERRELLHDLAVILNEDTDRFLLLRLDPRCRVHTIGKTITPVDPELFYLG